MSQLPNDLSSFSSEKDLSIRKNIFIHNIKLSSLKSVEEGFSQFLRQLCASEEQPINKS